MVSGAPKRFAQGVGLAVTVGLGAQQYFNLTTAAARTIVEPNDYIRAVLGERAADYARTGDASVLTPSVTGSYEKSAPDDEGGH